MENNVISENYGLGEVNEFLTFVQYSDFIVIISLFAGYLQTFIYVDKLFWFINNCGKSLSSLERHYYLQYISSIK